MLGKKWLVANLINQLRESDSIFFTACKLFPTIMCSSGDIENGVEHLGNAVAVCGQPQQLLQVLQQSLPAQVFQLLLMRLPLVGQVRLIDALYFTYFVNT